MQCGGANTTAVAAAATTFNKLCMLYNTAVLFCGDAVLGSPYPRSSHNGTARLCKIDRTQNTAALLLQHCTSTSLTICCIPSISFPLQPRTHSTSHLLSPAVVTSVSSQVPTGGSADDPHLVKHKVERLGKVISDTFTTSSEEAAADPNNLKGKSSDNKPDGTEVRYHKQCMIWPLLNHVSLSAVDSGFVCCNESVNTLCVIVSAVLPEA